MSHIRITGGQARGQKIQVPQVKSVRPSPDRARTTLFNWLMPFPQGIKVLDICAGSGILSFEALSRGAHEAHLVEAHRKVGEHLRHCAKTWPYGQMHLYASDCLKWLEHHVNLAPFELIFLDPPFHRFDLLQDCLDVIQDHHYLAENGFIYTERSLHTPPVTTPKLSVYREKHFGVVTGTLYINNA